jgi:UDP-4-amino-4,6-dideoxy-N-acetyl-beta-L-altrosamine transaminase
MIPYGHQWIDRDDVAAVDEVLHSDFLTQGPVVPRFEEAVASYCHASHAVAMNSATSALHLAVRAVGVGRGDLVWTSPITFVASANCALYCGAEIDFVDIDPLTFNMSPDSLRQKLMVAEAQGHLPKAVVVVDMCGQSAQLAEIRTLADQYGFAIVEDASHAIGARYEEAPVGNCRYSDIAVFSFHPVKIITTGEGGMALTNDVVLADKMRLLRTHGVTRAAEHLARQDEGPWYYEQIDLGFNYRLTEIQAGLGLSQLAKIDAFVGRRHVLARRYDEELASLPVIAPFRRPDAHSSFHLYVIQVDRNRTSRTRRQVFDHLRNAGIGVNVHYIPVYLQPYFTGMGFTAGYCPNAERYYRDAITIPLYPALAEDEQDMVVAALAEAVSA